MWLGGLLSQKARSGTGREAEQQGQGSKQTTTLKPFKRRTVRRIRRSVTRQPQAWRLRLGGKPHRLRLGCRQRVGKITDVLVTQSPDLRRDRSLLAQVSKLLEDGHPPGKLSFSLPGQSALSAACRSNPRRPPSTRCRSRWRRCRLRDVRCRWPWCRRRADALRRRWWAR